MRIEDVSAVILAGGYSSRMGRNKAELTLNGQTFIEIQLMKLRMLGITDIMISGYAPEIPGTRFVPDIIPHRGPVSGIHACLKAAKNDACLVIGVDVPLVPVEYLKALIDMHQAEITVTEHNGKLEPLMAVYSRDVEERAERILKSEKSKLMTLVCETRKDCLSYTGDERFLYNCNTPEDYERILRIAGDAGL